MFTETSCINPTIASLAPAVSYNEIQHAIDHFQIAEGYFSSILTIQTAVFSTIVVALVGLYFFFNKKTSKSEIEKISTKFFSDLRKEMQKEFDEKVINIQNIFSAEMKQQKNSIGYLTAQSHRTFGEFWDSEKKYATSFIWWLRGAKHFSLISQENLTQICLSKARDAIERVNYGFELSPETIGEYQKLMTEIPDIYKIEKDLLDVELKKTMSKKPQQVTSGIPQL